MTFEIEKGVPIPENKGGSKPKYPFAEMSVGDSFFVPDGKRQTVAPTANKASHRLGMKFSIKVVEGGLGIWRVE